MRLLFCGEIDLGGTFFVYLGRLVSSRRRPRCALPWRLPSLVCRSIEWPHCADLLHSLRKYQERYQMAGTREQGHFHCSCLPSLVCVSDKCTILCRSLCRKIRCLAMMPEALVLHTCSSDIHQMSRALRQPRNEEDLAVGAACSWQQ